MSVGIARGARTRKTTCYSNVEELERVKSQRIRHTSAQITPFFVMEILEKALALERQGRSIIHLEVGEPDFPTPRCITEAGIQAIRDGKTGYTASVGLLELREAIAGYYWDNYQLKVSPEDIIVTSGSSPALLLLFSVLLEPGDEVILPNPHYACYPNFVIHLGGRVVSVDVYEDNGFQYDPDEVATKIGPRTKAVVINSPSNPTGHLMAEGTIKKLTELGLTVISDEIYHGLVYEGKEHSVLEFTDRALVINGFSKRYSMTGWRLGYLIAPREYIRPLQNLQQNFFISANNFVQWAGIAAIERAQPDVERMVTCFDERRRLMLKRLKEMGFDITVDPTGAFYVLANAKKFSHDSLKLANEILEETGVGVGPGIDFGQNAEGYLRFSYASSIENISEGMDRLQAYLST